MDLERKIGHSRKALATISYIGDDVSIKSISFPCLRNEKGILIDRLISLYDQRRAERIKRGKCHAMTSARRGGTRTHRWRSVWCTSALPRIHTSARGRARPAVAASPHASFCLMTLKAVRMLSDKDISRPCVCVCVSIHSRRKT